MEKIPECFYRVSIKALILNEEKKFLLIKDGNGSWELPGGGLDHGESVQEGLAREIEEEMMLEVVEVKDQCSYFLTAFIPRMNLWIANVIFETKVKDFEFTPTKECLEIGFFSLEEAQATSLHPNIEKFIKMFDSKNHQ